MSNGRSEGSGLLRPLGQAWVWTLLLVTADPGTAWGADPVSTGAANAATAEGDYTRAQLVFGDPVPVVVWNRTIVEFRAGVADTTPEMRAVRAAERIAALPFTALDEPIRTAKVTAGELEGVQISVGGRLVVTVMADDVPPEAGVTLHDFTARAIANLRDVLAARQEQARPGVLFRGAAFSLGGTVLFVVFLVVAARARSRIATRAHGLLEGRPLKIFDVDVRPMLASLLRGIVTTVSVVLAIIIAYFWLAFVLTQFPYSEPVADQLGRWLVAQIADLGSGAADALPGLFTVAIIFFLTRLTTRAIGAIFVGIESGVIRVRWLVPETARTTRQLVSTVIWIFGLTFAYPYIPGSGTDAFRGISVLLGVMISLGSAGLINQVMSGLVIVYARGLGVGDIVQVGETEGVVSRLGLLSTKVTTLRGEEVTIPNAVVVSNRIVNFGGATAGIDAKISTTVTIGYDAPWRQVHALLLEAARSTTGILASPEPFVVQRALADFYVEYQLHVAKERGRPRYQVLSELHAAIQDAFNEAGVQIMSPHFEVQPSDKVYVPKEQWMPPAATR